MHRLLTATVAGLALASLGRAQFSNPYTPPFHGAPCTEHAGWDVFTSAFGGPNVPDLPGTTADDAVLVQTVAGAILTSTDNIYHPGAASFFELTDSVPADLQEVVFQKSTSGNPRDATSVVLAYDGPSGPVELLPTDSFWQVQVSGFEEVVFTWDLSANPHAITAYTIRWSASAPHMSLMGVLLDTRVACGPGTASCFGVACPCGNDDPTAGCATSLGTGATLGGAGSASVATDDLVLTATGTPTFVQGLFYTGSQTVQNPFYDGFQCALGTTLRFLGSIQSSGATGTMSHTGLVAEAGGLITAGTTWHFHAWFRDPGGPCGSGANLTNLYSVTYTP